MPRIAAKTVKEHRENIETALVDAAEEILRNEPGTELTAAAIAKRAGIARNSIYRYVTSVNDLRRLVIERYMPGWMAAVAAVSTPISFSSPAQASARPRATSRRSSSGVPT